MYRDSFLQDTVPDSLLLNIFRHLDFRSLLRISTVCRKWNRVCHDNILWRDFFSSDYSVTNLAPFAASWLLEYKRLYYHTPCIETRHLKSHTDQVLHVSFSHNGGLFATTSKDAHVKVWSLEAITTGSSNEPLHSFSLRMFNWKYSQFSEFNQSDTLLLVSGVHFGMNSTSGEIAVFDLTDGFRLQSRVLNKPYDIFGTWYNDQYILSGGFFWRGNLSSCSVIYINKALQDADFENETVVSQLFKFMNNNASSLRMIKIATPKLRAGQFNVGPGGMPVFSDCSEIAAVKITQDAKLNTCCHSHHHRTGSLNESPRQLLIGHGAANDCVDGCRLVNNGKRNSACSDSALQSSSYHRQAFVSPAPALSASPNLNRDAAADFRFDVAQQRSSPLCRCRSSPCRCIEETECLEDGTLRTQAYEIAPRALEDPDDSGSSSSLCSAELSNEFLQEELGAAALALNVSNNASSLDEVRLARSAHTSSAAENSSHSRIPIYPRPRDLHCTDSSRVATGASRSLAAAARKEMPRCVHRTLDVPTCTTSSPCSCGSLVAETRNDAVEKLMIFTCGDFTYVPHQIGIKRIRDSEALESFRNREGYGEGPVKGQKGAKLQRLDSPDVKIEMHGHVIGMALSSDNCYLYVNLRAWPDKYKLADPLDPPPISQNIEVRVIDLLAVRQVGTMYRSHEAFTSNDNCFFIFLDVNDLYIASGAENNTGYLWDRYYNTCLARYEHDDVVNATCFCPTDPETLVSVSDDFSIKIWQSRNWVKELRRVGHSRAAKKNSRDKHNGLMVESQPSKLHEQETLL